MAHIDVRNLNSDRPLLISNAFTSDKTDTLLKIDQSEQISKSMEGDSMEMRQRANAAAVGGAGALRDAAAYNAMGAPSPVWASSLAEGVASAITSNLLGSEAADIKERARYIRENVFQNRPIPKGYADRGLIFFVRGDRVYPYTLHLDLYNGERTESYAFAFSRPSFEDMLSCAPASSDEREKYINNFSIDERNLFIKRAGLILMDEKRRTELKASNPQELSVIQWMANLGEAETVPYLP